LKRAAGTVAALLVSWPALVIPAAAQEPAPLAVGQRVRVRVGETGRLHAGTLAALRGDTLVLDRGPRGPLALPLSSVMQLERSRGPGRCRRPGARLECVVLWTLVGAVAGSVIAYQATRCTNCDSSGIGVILGLPVGAGVGFVVGAVIGGERWEPLPVSGGRGPP
jgi:hypothetical protein